MQEDGRKKCYCFNNRVYACRPDTNFILQINASTNSIEDTIVVGKGPSSLGFGQQQQTLGIKFGRHK